MLADSLKKIDDNQEVINSYRPFNDPELLKEIQSFYRVGIVYSSNAIEGYTYTLSETKVLLEDGLTAGGKPMRDAYAVLGHAKAYDYMFTLLHNDKIRESDILKMHKMLGESLDNQAIAGQYRDKPAFITGSEYPVADANDIQKQMNMLFEYVEKNRNNMHPVEIAAQLHKNLVFIHPFSDGNGRVSRLAMNTILIQNSYLPVVIPPVIRHDYVTSLEKAHKNDSEFVKLIAQCEIETQKEMIRLLKGHSQSVKKDEESPQKKDDESVRDINDSAEKPHKRSRMR